MVPPLTDGPIELSDPGRWGQSQAFCGELVITAANGKKSIDAVTVTIGGKAPTYVNGRDRDETTRSRRPSTLPCRAT
ncbi:hypothetical protein ACFOPS_04690 [Ralstonia solanacearum]|uniref:hypothetical protein n=1 Tax=Ralstonia solanacearum TaxID=305 RepID=UPI0036089C44